MVINDLVPPNHDLQNLLPVCLQGPEEQQQHFGRATSTAAQPVVVMKWYRLASSGGKQAEAGLQTE